MKAIEEEVVTLKQSQTWDLVSKPKDAKLIICKWVYKIKKHPDGSVQRYKVKYKCATQEGGELEI